jgi:hypothetical protein
MTNRKHCAGTLVVAILGIAGAGAPPAASFGDSGPMYRGLELGKATPADVETALGSDHIDWRYPVVGDRPLNDRLYFSDGRLTLVTAASPDERYPSRAAVEQSLGEPEAEIIFQKQQFLDYTSRGLRFVCDADGATTGVIYFTRRARRVPPGYPQARIDLRRDKTPPTPAQAPADFRAGAAELSIAPQNYDGLVGDTSMRVRLAEDLFVRAAVFERDRTRVVLVGMDVFGMGPWDLQKIREHLREQGFPSVILAMSHTHANVDTIGFYGHYPAEYAKYIVERTVAVVKEAARRIEPIRELRTGNVEMPLVGGRVVDLIRNGRDPGILDPTVSLLQAIGEDGRPIVNVVHLACHPEVIDLKRTRGLSPDFVGRLCRDVERGLGGQTVFLNGALGGMVTPDTPGRTQAAAEKMGAELAKFVLQAAEVARQSGSYVLWMYRQPVIYPITGESVSAFMQHPPVPIELDDGRFESEINVLWIGDAQFISVPGELLPETGMEITSRMTGHVRGIIGLANGELGYLVPSYDFRVGHYEERTGPGAAGGDITRMIGLELAELRPEANRGGADDKTNF